ncbi:hypothetical protein [Phenylobacterium sp.]|uniref:hypothetical protein n=1 Tax=Phenylobacterium sp. TaxID=1871053 RepID=UPI002736D8A3|nr:hypothetical protein [Phenylobacterium sp.]MDP3853872.1 hypothetical protein [Phenylobacterium sp.]
MPDQVALTVAAFTVGRQDDWPGPGRMRFGCFACNNVADADGSVPIHFRNFDTDAAGGPLVRIKLARRRDEMAALVEHILTKCPDAKHVRGRSWLYHLPAYRRVFPPAYVASAEPVEPEARNFQGNSLWGQVIDSEEQLRPDVTDMVMAALPTMDLARPWTVFPFGLLATRASLEKFVEFYRL